MLLKWSVLCELPWRECASLLAMLTLVYNAATRPNNESSCQSLLTSGRFVNSSWRPQGCQMHHYDKRSLAECMGNRMAKTGRVTLWVLMGDSRIRTLYESLCLQLGMEELTICRKNRNENRHVDMQFTHPNMSLTVTFLWQPIFNGVAQERLRKIHNETVIPSLIFTGNTLHYLVDYYPNTSLALSLYKKDMQNFVKVTSLFLPTTSVTFSMQAPVNSMNMVHWKVIPKCNAKPVFFNKIREKFPNPAATKMSYKNLMDTTKKINYDHPVNIRNHITKKVKNMCNKSKFYILTMNPMIEKFNEAATQIVSGTGCRIFSSIRTIGEAELWDYQDGTHPSDRVANMYIEILQNLDCNQYVEKARGKCCSKNNIPYPEMVSIVFCTFGCVMLLLISLKSKLLNRNCPEKITTRDRAQSAAYHKDGNYVTKRENQRTKTVNSHLGHSMGSALWDLLKSCTQFGIILIYIFLCDRTDLFIKESKEWTDLSFGAILLIAFVRAVIVRRTIGGQSLAATGALIPGSADHFCIRSSDDKNNRLNLKTEDIIVNKSSNYSEHESITQPVTKPKTNASIKPASVLSRDLTEEWKGWMQVVILAYHLTGMSGHLPTYVHVRLLVGAYLFLTGYGHVTRAWEGGALSFTRYLQVMFRLNLLAISLCVVMSRPYQLYYFVPLVSFWYTVLHLVLSLPPRLAPLDKGSEELVPRRTVPDFFRIGLKLIVMIIIINMLLKEAIFDWLFNLWPSSILFLRNTGGLREWRFRWMLDRYSTLLGALFALSYQAVVHYNHHYYATKKTTTTTATTTTTSTPRVVISTVCTLLLALLCICIPSVMLQFCFSKTDCNAVHTYIVWLPVLGYMLLRHLLLQLWPCFSPLMAWLGRIALELFVCQYHVWLTTDATRVLVLLPHWPPYINMVVTTVIFVALANEVHHITAALVKALQTILATVTKIHLCFALLSMTTVFFMYLGLQSVS